MDKNEAEELTNKISEMTKLIPDKYPDGFLLASINLTNKLLIEACYQLTEIANALKKGHNNESNA